MIRKKMNAETTNDAVLYIRVSTSDQAENGVSLDAQAERLTAYAASCGLSVVAVLREEAISGTVPLAERPKGATLVRMLKSGEALSVTIEVA